MQIGSFWLRRVHHIAISTTLERLIHMCIILPAWTRSTSCASSSLSSEKNLMRYDQSFIWIFYSVAYLLGFSHFTSMIIKVRFCFALASKYCYILSFFWMLFLMVSTFQVVIFRDGKYLTLREVFESLDLTGYSFLWICWFFLFVSDIENVSSQLIFAIAWQAWSECWSIGCACWQEYLP